jgi:hypothetical protein
MKEDRWAGHVARMTGRRNAYWVLAGKLERKLPLEDPDLVGKWCCKTGNVHIT